MGLAQREGGTISNRERRGERRRGGERNNLRLETGYKRPQSHNFTTKRLRLLSL
jgi:hypothetical protein